MFLPPCTVVFLPPTKSKRNHAVAPGPQRSSIAPRRSPRSPRSPIAPHGPRPPRALPAILDRSPRSSSPPRDPRSLPGSRARSGAECEKCGFMGCSGSGCPSTSDLGCVAICDSASPHLVVSTVGQAVLVACHSCHVLSTNLCRKVVRGGEGSEGPLGPTGKEHTKCVIDGSPPIPSPGGPRDSPGMVPKPTP